MAKDFMATQDGDLIIDPDTHDFAMIDGIDEVAQRIRTTLLIREGEMVNLDPQQGADYDAFLGKNFEPNAASADMTSAIEANVPEVTEVQDISFKRLQNRKLAVSFSCVAELDDDTTDIAEGGFEA